MSATCKNSISISNSGEFTIIVFYLPIAPKPLAPGGLAIDYFIADIDILLPRLAC